MEDKVNIVPFIVIIDYMISKTLHIAAHWYGNEFDNIIL